MMDDENLSDWGENNDGRISFEDSDRFDEDMSLCSWCSDQESICGDWRGWKRSNNDCSLTRNSQTSTETLIELCCKVVAMSVPFETVEQNCPNLPEDLLLRIAFWSFPRSDDNIRLYSCLANGSSEEFSKGEQLYRAKAVVETLQIGFHLNGVILPQYHGMVVTNNDMEQLNSHKSAVLFDQGHVTSCSCTCNPSAAWCSHIVALCLHRIYQSHMVPLRPPLSESLSKLKRHQLQKFSQYLISEVPHELLPYAQKLLDELLSSNDQSKINTFVGAPDPTAGPPAEIKNHWWMDDKALRENVRKMLSKFCGPGPFILEEAYNLQFASTAPPTAAEWSNLLKPLTSHEPEGMWNLLSIVRELFRHRDMNALEVLELLTQECLSFEQIVVWWFNGRIQGLAKSKRPAWALNSGGNSRNCINTASTEMTKNACASFCDEIVALWRLACLNPLLTKEERLVLKARLEEWHNKTIEKVRNARYLGEHILGFSRASENFPGFKIAIEACSLDWSAVMLASAAAHKNTLRQRAMEEIRGHKSAEDGERKNVCDLNEDTNTLFARAQALHVHGYPEVRQVCEFLAEKILVDAFQKANDSALRGENLEAEDSNCFIKTTVARASFLCSVLSMVSNKHHLAFRIGLHGLETARKPARNKALEVKLANQETELVNLLAKLLLGISEIAVVREKARSLCDEMLERDYAALPLKFALFLFQVLREQSSEEDKELGFKAALAALTMKTDVLESEFPMLCEGIRRQRGELAMVLLDYYKDNPVNLEQVKWCLLDKNRYGLDTRYNGSWFVGKNQGRSSKSREKTQNREHDRAGSFQQRRKLTSDDVVLRQSIHKEQMTTSQSTSSGSRQSSWSSCLSDDLSPREELRAARDSGRDSDNDVHELPAQSSRENFSEGEIHGDHSPGEEVAADGRVHEGTGDVTRSDALRNPNDESAGVETAFPRGDSGTTEGTPRESSENNLQPSDDGWIEDNGWCEDGGPSRRIDNEAGSGNCHQSRGKRNGKLKNNKRGHGKVRSGKRDERAKKTVGSYQGDRSLEAEAHFMFELAKKVLMLAGGVTHSPNSLFGQVDPTSSNVSHGMCNRSLQLCAFELGLFALGLHNMTCFNWLSRTYSAHVSWISTQALELGNAALKILLENWNPYLTPSETASIADRASKSNDQAAVRNAAQLALSCLTMAHTLNPGNIRSALAQCKDQDTELLTQACAAVETAAQGGGVYPEVLFEVAKHWEYLYEQAYPAEERITESGQSVRGDGERRTSLEDRGSRESLEESESRGDDEREQRTSAEDYDSRVGHGSQSARGQHEDCNPTRTPLHGHQPSTLVMKLSRLGLNTNHHVQSKPYNYVDSRNYGVFVRLPTPEQMVQQQITQQVQHLIEAYHQTAVPHQLASTYRVGMLALENIARRPTDDRSNAMFAKNPPCKADIHWLCKVASKVGLSALQRFCVVCANSIHSPFLLHELALEAAGLMAKSNPSQIVFHLRSVSVTPMVQKCLMNYTQCVQQTLNGLSKSEYAEFVELIMHARGAYSMAPGGMTQFNELLQNIRRNTVKKKDLWQKITSGLAHQPK